MEQDFRHVVDHPQEEVQKLASHLEVIQEAVFDVGPMKLMKDNYRYAVDTLKSFSNDVDDALDEWSYEILKSKFVTRPTKVWSSILASTYDCFPCVVPRNHIAFKISKLSATLYDFDRQITGKLGSNDEQVERNVTTSDIDMRKVKGREAEKEKLVNLLLMESGELPLPKLHTISIIGMRGIGKTTLAQIVYNDENVKSYFDIRIWVCVSKPFDRIRIAKAILESLIGHSPDLDELESIAAEIQQYMEGKKFLLALDDVWREDLREWRELEAFLVGGSSGSKMLVTTCDEKVAELIGCIDADIFRIGLLQKEECWSLFCEIAFRGWSSEEREKLETIGVMIVERCQGLPPALEIIARLLCVKKSMWEWKRLLNMEFGEKDEVQQYLFHPLWLSYCDLPLPLKQCFLYCVTFPKGYRMSKDELISLWMAHGFLKSTIEDRDMEKLGHGYFNDLCMRFLFQDVELKEKFNKFDKTYCRMHNIVHNFAGYMMGKECLYIEVNSAEEATSCADASYSDGIYHLHVHLGENVEFLESFYNLRKLRSLVVFPLKKVSLIGAALPRIFNEFTCLRSLSLSRCHLESIPLNINRLIHLRWLKLSKNHALRELPETICELHHLQTLSVNWCGGLVGLPKGVKKLINLRHLKNEYTYFLLPKGIGTLTGLRKLPKITIDPKSKDTFSLRDLENLNNISGSLTIFFMERKRVTLVEDAKQAQLEEKKHITALSLNFPERAAEEWMQQEDEELVRALKPPPSLEMLRITCYKGANFLSWINTLTSLKRLKLWYWGNCELLPALAKLPCLEYIEFCYFGSVRKVAAEFYRVDGVIEASTSTAPLFPKLKNLQFMNMMEWEEWSDYEGDEEVMPCLSYLSIENCPKLKALPKFIYKKNGLRKQNSG